MDIGDAVPIRTCRRDAVVASVRRSSKKLIECRKFALRLSANWLAVDLLQAKNIGLEPGKCWSQYLRTSLQRNMRFGRQVQALQVECRNPHGFNKNISERRLTRARPSAFIVRWLDV